MSLQSSCAKTSLTACCSVMIYIDYWCFTDRTVLCIHWCSFCASVLCACIFIVCFAFDKVLYSTTATTLHHHVKLECSSCTRYHWVVRESNSKIYPTSNVASNFARFEFSGLQRVGILRQKVYKTCITEQIWIYRQRQWRMAAAITTWSSLASSILICCLSSPRSVVSISNTFS